MEQEKEIILNGEWEVWTPDGWSDFDGLIVSHDREIIEINYNDKILHCTKEHKIFHEGNFIEAQTLDHKFIRVDNVYDLMNVKKNHAYYTNDIVSHNCLVLDEFAFVHDDTSFMTSTYPVVSAGQSTQIIIVSTANGIGSEYHKIWEKAVSGRNSYKPIRIDWWDVPGRDEKWKEETIANTSLRQFRVEFGNQFIGSTDTLIDGDYLLELVQGAQSSQPLMEKESDCLRIYEEPQRDHVYMMTVDVSRGRGKDYSTFSIFDVTQMPYKQVVAYNNNIISPLLLPSVIFKYATVYNNALAIIESNDQGAIVANAMYYEFEYENLFVESAVKRNGVGVEVTKKVKTIGCSNLKDLVEEKKLIIPCQETVLQLCTFIADGSSYNASPGNHDDLVQNLWLFAWFITLNFFQEVTKNTGYLSQQLFEEKMKAIKNDVPFAGILGSDETFDKLDYLRSRGYSVDGWDNDEE